MSALRTRKPTGLVAWPLVLVEGGEKAGKSYAAYRLSADERVGRSFVFDLGEGTADEYAELGPYEVVAHNGTFSDLIGQIEAACAEPTEPGVPNVVVIDSATAVWDLLKDWTDARARQSRTGRQKLAEDPDAEIDPAMNLWNDAKDRWYRVINTIRRSDVIGVLVARAKEVAKVQGGQPVAGQTDYRVEAEKTTPFAVTAQVRMTRPHNATLVAVRSLHVDVPAKGLRLPAENPIGHLVFDVMKAGAGSGPAQITHGTVGLARAEAQHKLLDYLASVKVPDPKTAARELWDEHGTDAAEVPVEVMVKILDAAGAYVESLNEEPEEPELPGHDAVTEALNEATAKTEKAK